MDKEFIADAYAKYGASAYKLALIRSRNVHTAEDTVQEVFLRLCKKQAADFESDEHLKAWILRTTINFCKNIFKSAWNKTELEIDENTEGKAGISCKDIDVITEVMKLPEKYRSIIHLYYYEGYELGEISVILGINPATIRTRMTRAKEKLKERLGEDYEQL